ncbi:hypothetical protein MNBD_GAMMA12-2220 [hydrothermal vent metagenome]|uniref:Uncharacterized protein n=1 Tax=hydrothermal vent metagenome TaxID=652676 RepID=A0A3B0Y5P7_9ZZZZ
MKLSKYFALVLVLLAGQAMAGPNYNQHNRYNASVGQVRNDAQRLLNAERSLLVSIHYYRAAYSQASRDMKKLIHNTIRFRNSAPFQRNNYSLRARLRSIRRQFAHLQRSIAKNSRLRHVHAIQTKLRNIGYDISTLSQDVYSVRRYVY